MPPAQCFGALGLTISLYSFIVVAYVRHKIVAMRLHGRHMLLHCFSLILAIAAAFGGNGVAAYPHHTSRVMHNAFAALCVLGALLHFSLEVRVGNQAGWCACTTCSQATHSTPLHFNVEDGACSVVISPL